MSCSGLSQVYTVVPFSHTVKTRQPVDTSHYFPLTQICGKSTSPSVLSYLSLQFPPRQYDRRIRHGLAGRIRTARADIPVFYTLGTSLGIRGRRCEVWTYLIKLEKGEVQAYHHNVSRDLTVDPVLMAERGRAIVLRGTCGGV
jgi:hypothetical protein